MTARQPSLRTGKPGPATKGIGIFLAGMAVALALTPWGLHWDFASVYDTGHRVLAGEAPYLYVATRPIEGSPPLGVMRFWSAPLAGLFYAPLAWLPPDVALRIFKLQNVLALGLSLMLLWWLYGVRLEGSDTRRPLALALALCVVFQPFWTVFLTGGQTTPTALLLLTLSLSDYLAGRFWLVGLWMSIVFVLKPAFVLMAGMFLIAWEWQLLSALSAWLLAEGLIGIAVLGWTPHAAFLSQALNGLGAPRLWQYNSSLSAFVENFRLLWPDQRVPPFEATVLAAAVAMTRLWVLALFFMLWRRAATRPLRIEGRRHLLFMMAVLFFLLMSEIVWEHYLMVLFFPLAFIAVRADRFSPSARLLAAGAFLLCAAQNIGLMLMLDRAIQPDTVLEIAAVGLLKSGPLILMLTLLTLFGEEWIAAHEDLRFEGAPYLRAAPAARI